MPAYRSITEESDAARLDLNLRREPILALGATEGSSVVAVRCPTNKVKHHIN